VTILILDVSPLVYRAHFAVAADAERRGETVRVADTSRRLFAMVERLVTQLRPTMGAAALDLPHPTWRHEFYPLYKDGRASKTPELRELLDVAPDIVRALGMPTVAEVGYEADDLICSLVHQHQGAIVVSGDKDFYQFHDVNACRIWDPTRKAKGAPDTAWPGTWIKEEDVHDKFGVGAAQVVEVQALCGDRVDAIPGCEGVGPKGAIALIEAFETVAAMYAALEAKGVTALPKPCRRYATKLAANKADVMLSLALVTMRTDLDVRIRRVTPPNTRAVATLALRLGWNEQQQAAA
jgi:5'-3' exonuclease